MKVVETHLDVLQNIEFVIASEYQANESLADRQVLDAVQGLVRQYAAECRGQRHMPSIYLSPGAQSVFESVRDICEFRLGRQSSHVANANGELEPAAPIDLEDLVQCLKRLRDSIRFWSKAEGARGYLDFVTPMVAPQVLVPQTKRGRDDPSAVRV